MKTRPLLVFAMEQERQNVFLGYDTIFTGIGKVNAAFALTNSLRNSMPGIVINLGTAGSRKHKGGSVINCTSFVQRDMDVSGLGFPKWKTPFSEDPITISYGMAVEALPQGLCGTGDSFDVSDEALHFDVVDMEAYSLALICQRLRVPFLCLKYVSDNADENAGRDFETGLQLAAGQLLKSLKGAGF